MASPQAIAFIRERGGRLWVRGERYHCCQGVTTLLAASTDAPEEAWTYLAIEAAGFTLLVDRSLTPLPDQLDVALKRFFRPHIAVYWNGCDYVLR